MKPYLIFRRLSIKAVPIYTCDFCKVRGEGSTFKKDEEVLMQAGEIGELFKIFEKDVSNSHMPLGWRSYTDKGRSVHLCPTCHGKELYVGNL